MKLSFHLGYAVFSLLYMLGIYMLSATPDYGSGGLINLVPNLLLKVLHVLIFAGLAWLLLETFSGETPEHRAFDRSAVRRFGGMKRTSLGSSAVRLFGSPPTQRTQELNNSITALQSAASCLLPASSHTRLYALAGILAASYAALDEWHQSFVVGRTPRITDVLLDCFGIAGLLLVRSMFLSRRPGEINRQKGGSRKHA